MFKYILTSFKEYRLGYLKNDIPAGIIVAALTIPVAMGYAGVAGLPPVYGLYASMLPVLGYAVFASSPQGILGADASASAITGSCLAALGIASGSENAISAATMLSLFVGIFLILFAVFRLGRFAEYISKPVMSGFMSGTALSIIFGQIPKILGIQGSGNDFISNAAAIVRQCQDINPLSLLLGAVTAALILIGKKHLPKIPVALIVMVLGTVITALLRLDLRGVAIVGDIPAGLPSLSLPALPPLSELSVYVGAGFVIAIVIFADSLMSMGSFATQEHYPIDNNREIFAFGVSNLCASVSGCAPASASVSRMAASKQFHGKSQMVSVVAVLIVGLVVAFLGGTLYYMPQPVLGGIVLAALVGVVEVSMLRNLLRCGRNEAAIWLVSAAGVLVVGTLFGVLVGMLLSFIDVIMRITTPPQACLGTIDGRDGYFDLNTHKSARAIPGVVIYRFSARLFFGNVGIFKAGIRQAVEKDHPKAIIVDAAGINSIDATAADELRELLDSLDDQHIRCCFAGQTEVLNKQLALYGLNGDSRLMKTINDALRACDPAASTAG